jgi:Uma2 family endonuclease
VERRICNALERMERLTDTQIGILNTRGDVRVADVAVFSVDPDPRAAWHPASSIHVVVEVWAPSSDDKDRDPRWYADRGIPEYWLAEPVEGEKWGALITRRELAHTPGGTTAFVETGKTTLEALEASSGA